MEEREDAKDGIFFMRGDGEKDDLDPDSPEACVKYEEDFGGQVKAECFEENVKFEVEEDIKHEPPEEGEVEMVLEEEGSNRERYLEHCARQHLAPGDLAFTCDQCGRSFPSSRLLKGHLRVHSSSLECPQCGRSCPTAATLRIHMEYAHSSERPFACGQCDYRARTEADLAEHGRIHTAKECSEPNPASKEGEEKLNSTCEFCGKRFPKGQERDRHVKVVHLKEKPHECEECGRRFGLKQSLRSHVLTVHRQERPHACQEDGCGKTFARTVDLLTHMKSVHLQLREFKCAENECGETFRRKRDLSAHLRRLHGHEGLVCGVAGCGHRKSFGSESGLRRHWRVRHGITGDPVHREEVHHERSSGLARSLDTKHASSLEPGPSLAGTPAEGEPGGLDDTEGAIKVEPGLVVATELQVKEEPPGLEATPLFTC